MSDNKESDKSIRHNPVVTQLGDDETRGSGSTTKLSHDEVKEGINKRAKEGSLEATAIKHLEEKVDEEILSLQKQKNRLVEVLGVFAALFTFISIEIQLMKSLISLWSLVGITFITAGLLFCFVIALNITFRDSSFEIKKYLPSIIFSCGFIIIGMVAAYAGGDVTAEMIAQDKISEKYYTREEIDTKLEYLNNKSNSIDENINLEKFKRCILGKGLTYCVIN